MSSSVSSRSFTCARHEGGRGEGGKKEGAVAHCSQHALNREVRHCKATLQHKRYKNLTPPPTRKIMLERDERVERQVRHVILHGAHVGQRGLYRLRLRLRLLLPPPDEPRELMSR